MNGKVRIISAFCLSIFILILIGLYAYINTNNYKFASDWVHHTQQVISKAQKMLSDIQDVETSQRGYVLTGNNKYLIPYNEALQDLDDTYLALNDLVKDNAMQSTLLDSINVKTMLKLDFVKEVIKTRKEKGFEPAQKLVLTEVGENLMTELRIIIRKFIANEEAFLAERLVMVKEKYTSTITIIISSVVLTIVVLLITLYFFIKDHNRRILSEKKVLESELRVKKFLDSLPLGVFVIGANKKAYYANGKSMEILGKGINPEMPYSELSEIYKAYIANTDTLYPPDQLPGIRALNGESYICIEDLEIEKNGQRIALRINATPVTNSDNEIEYAISIFEDITELKDAEQKLLQAKKLAEESSILKETFLANMSHEIRTPMNAIIGFTDLLLKKELQAQEREYIQIIKTSGENLLRIINDILDVSKIDSGMMVFEEHPISIRQTFSSLQIMLSHKAREKNLDLSFDYDPAIPETLLGDPTRLTQIILNLVGNAIKFTKKGSVEIYAKSLNEDQEKCMVAFFVKDTGIGIPEDKLAHVFERFRQAESHTTRNYGGTGLGLSIAKQLVELQGGEINAKSILGFGSVFSFILPFKKTDKTYISHHKTPDEIQAAELNNLNILLAEDNPVNIKFVLSLFSDYNLKVDVAENGKLAIEKLKNNSYDIVLMDIEMPEMNGYETTKVIRDELKSSIPIIAMTAHALAGEREKCLQLGMNDYVPKPIRADLLFEKIALAIETKPTSKEIQPPQNKKIINLEFITKSMKGRKELILDTIEIFLEQIPEDLSDINGAIKNADYTAVKSYAHRMKSTVSLMGVMAIQTILEQMEALAINNPDAEQLKKLNQTLYQLSQQAIEEIQVEKLNYI